METILAMLTVQAIVGAFDNLWHHEIVERLPSKVGARNEVGLHAIREFFYAGIFIIIAWYAPLGVWAWLFAALFLIEIAVTLTDFIIEDRTRRLPHFERVLHTLLAINFGAIMAFLLPEIHAWTQQPTGIAPRDYGTWSWLMTLFSVGVLAWAVRDAVAFVTLTGKSVPEWQRSPIKAGSHANARTVLVTGGTGFIGGHLCRALIGRGTRVIVLSRDPALVRYRFGPHVRAVANLDEIADIETLDAIVNLAGAPIAGWPWTGKRKKLLLDSRLGVTRQVLELIDRLDVCPEVLISGSAIGYYGVRGDEKIDETAGSQDIFMSRLCAEWEELSGGAGQRGLRVCLLRTGLVLGRDGGVFPQLALSARLGLGSVLGDGRQGVSWIHIDDIVSMVQWLIDDHTVHGPVNGTAPTPVSQRDFIRGLARSYGRRVWLRAPKSVIKLVLGKLSDLFVEGQWVLPAKARQGGFCFAFSALDDALAQLTKAPDAVAAVPSDAQSLSLHYNRDCPVCRWEADIYDNKARSAGIPLSMCDTGSKPEALLEWGLGPEDIKRRMYVLDLDGKLRGGVDAFIAIWSVIPAYRWRAKLIGLPVVRQLAAAVYDGLLAPSLAAWNARRTPKPTHKSRRSA